MSGGVTPTLTSFHTISQNCSGYSGKKKFTYRVEGSCKFVRRFKEYEVHTLIQSDNFSKSTKYHFVRYLNTLIALLYYTVLKYSLFFEANVS